VAVRNNLNKKMFTDGHKGRTLQADYIRLYFLSEAASTSLRPLREIKNQRAQPWLQATSDNGVGFIPILHGFKCDLYPPF
jgi:hypothetical protein